MPFELARAATQIGWLLSCDLQPMKGPGNTDTLLGGTIASHSCAD